MKFATGTEAFEHACVELEAAASTLDWTLAELREYGRIVGLIARHADASALERWAGRFAERLGSVGPAGGGVLARALGAFVEVGLPPGLVAESIFAVCRRALRAAAPFHAVLAAAGTDEVVAMAEERGEEILYGGDFSIPVALARDVARRHAVDAGPSYTASEDLCLAAIACLTRDGSLRRSVRADSSFAAEAEPLRRDTAKWLYQLLVAITEEDWVVIHATAMRGYVVRAIEVSDNWCIQPLLAAALTERVDGLAGAPPPMDLIACLRGAGPQSVESPVRGRWEVYDHRCFDPTGTFRPGMLDHKVWNEGIPLDIPRVAGQRVLILGPQIVMRTWRGGRSFGALGSDLVWVRTLERSEVDTWIGRSAAG